MANFLKVYYNQNSKHEQATTYICTSHLSHSHSIH